MPVKSIRRPARLVVLLVVFASLTAGCALVQPLGSGNYWPTHGWRTSTPEAQGMDSAQLAQLLEVIQQEPVLNLHSLLVIRHGYLVSEVYFDPFYGRNTKHALYSVTKSFMSTLVGIAFDKGILTDLRHPVLDFFPHRTFEKRDALKESMTLEDLLTLRCGLAWDEVTSWGELLWSLDAVKYVLDKPMTDPPGTKYLYNSGCSHVLSGILEEQPGVQTLEFAKKNLFEPLGITDFIWELDKQGIPLGGAGLNLTPRDMAKLGYLYLHEGVWDGQQIVSAAWVKAATQTHTDPHHKLGFGYGYQWWTFPRLGAYQAAGYGGQYIVVVPASDLVVVVTADQGDLANEAVFRLIEAYILTAVKSPGPLVENPAGQAELAAQTKVSMHLPPPTPFRAAEIHSTADQWFVLILGAFGLWAMASQKVYLGGAGPITGWAARGIGLAALVPAIMRAYNGPACNMMATYGNNLDLSAYLLALIAVCGGMLARRPAAAGPGAQPGPKPWRQPVAGWVVAAAGAVVGCLLGIALEHPELYSVATFKELGQPLFAGLGLAVVPVFILGYANPAPATVSKMAVLASSLLLGWLFGYLGQAAVDLLWQYRAALAEAVGHGIGPLLGHLSVLWPAAAPAAEAPGRWFLLFLLVIGLWMLVGRRLYLGGGYQIRGWGASAMGLLLVVAALLHSTHYAGANSNFLVAVCFSHNTVACLLALATLLCGLLAQRGDAPRPDWAALLRSPWMYTALSVGVGGLLGVALRDPGLLSAGTPAALARFGVTGLGLAAAPLALVAQASAGASRRAIVVAVIGGLFLGGMFGYVGEAILGSLWPLG
jgi:CubicO group peptidase (beta-lactamase class C family)